MRLQGIQPVPLGAISLCVLLAILAAGLWPFHAPRNDVSWLIGTNGLFFGKHGSIVSAKPLEVRASGTSQSCSLEIWLEPKRLRSEGTVLAFYWPSRRVVSFALRQWRNGLVMERESQGHSAGSANIGTRAGTANIDLPSIYVPDVFRRQEPVFFAISSGTGGTVVYVDGKPVKNAPNFVLSSRDLSGELVVGNSPSTTYNWSGQVKGIAIYQRELMATEVAQDFVAWTRPGPTLAASVSDGLVARYDFNEGGGNVVGNQADASTGLVIPRRFFILHEQFLERPWNEFHPGWHYWKDIAVNIVGFIPLGFFFAAYFSTTSKSNRAMGLTIGLGFAVSLTIEVLQAFLPTRDSGMTDLITNTFGTALGTLAFGCGMKRWSAAAGKLALPAKSEDGRSATSAGQ